MRHISHSHIPSIHHPPTIQHSLQLQHSSHFSSHAPTPTLLPSILTNHLPDSSSHRFSLVPFLPNQLQPIFKSRLFKIRPSPQHPIYKTAHPSVLDYPSRNPTPVLPKPSVLANQSTNHTPCHHSQHSRVGCESRFYITSRRFDPHCLQINFWPPCP